MDDKELRMLMGWVLKLSSDDKHNNNPVCYWKPKVCLLNYYARRCSAIQYSVSFAEPCSDEPSVLPPYRYRYLTGRFKRFRIGFLCVANYIALKFLELF